MSDRYNPLTHLAYPVRCNCPDCRAQPPVLCSAVDELEAEVILRKAAEKARDEARALLAECRPVVERAEWVFTPPKGTCIWGATEQVALLARLDAALGEP